MKTQKLNFSSFIFGRKFLKYYSMYTVLILFAHSLDPYGGNCVSDFLFRSSFLFYAKNRET